MEELKQESNQGSSNFNVVVVYNLSDLTSNDTDVPAELEIKGEIENLMDDSSSLLNNERESVQPSSMNNVPSSSESEVHLKKKRKMEREVPEGFYTHRQVEDIYTISSAALARVTAERDALKEERNKLKSERDTLLIEQNTLRTQMDSSRNELNLCQTEKSELRKEFDELKRDRDTYLEARDIMERETRKELRNLESAITDPKSAKFLETGVENIKSALNAHRICRFLRAAAYDKNGVYTSPRLTGIDDWVDLGYGVSVRKAKLHMILSQSNSGTTLTKKLMDIVFTRKDMLNGSITGKCAANGEVKKVLDQTKVQAIARCVLQKFPQTTWGDIRISFLEKLNEITKLYAGRAISEDDSDDECY